MALCLKGLHDLDLPDAWYVRPSGKRQCRACRAAWGARKHATNPSRWHREHPDRAKAIKGRYLERVNSDTRQAAFRHRQEWTGPELDICSRPDLTVREMAALTGRTYAAVANMKVKLREDPRKYNFGTWSSEPSN